MINNILSYRKKAPPPELPQWISCHERLPGKYEATKRGYVRVIWKSTPSIDGNLDSAWEVGIDHYENAHTYLGWMPIHYGCRIPPDTSLQG
ncbi:hypothetical protein ACJJIF_06455 [Microbulbifer sp. SSSA002]|uniref:hypothetical protein n=1 Tax=Microbulbifer sp. SSSA002 TaxID=3243376 RepID=UPI004039EF3C